VDSLKNYIFYVPKDQYIVPKTRYSTALHVLTAETLYSKGFQKTARFLIRGAILNKSAEILYPCGFKAIIKFTYVIKNNFADCQKPINLFLLLIKTKITL